jgi:hypothetical protein
MLPFEILVKICSNLSPYEITILEGVCKTFEIVCCSDEVWQEFLMISPGIILPKERRKKAAFQYMWANSIIVGKERWYPVVLPDLAKYEDELRKEEMQQSAAASESKFVVYHRLNPMYPLTTKCINNEDPAMVKIVQLVFDQFGYIDELTPEDRGGFHDHEDLFIRDARTCILWSCYVNKRNVLSEVVYNLESLSILNPDNNIGVDFSGNRTNLDGANYRLNKDLFHQIKAIVDKSRNYANYSCNHGCTIDDAYTSSFPYARSLLVGNEFAIYSVRHFPPPTDV